MTNTNTNTTADLLTINPLDLERRAQQFHGTAPFKVGDTVRCYALPARVIEIVRRAPHPTDEQRLGTWTRVERFGVVFIDDHEHRTGQG